MMECKDATEKMIHDSGARLASFMYNKNNTFTIGRDAEWGEINIITASNYNTANGYSMKSWLKTSSYFNDKWKNHVGAFPTNGPISLIIWHSTTTINYRWWFNGTQTSTNSEISDERIKRNS